MICESKRYVFPLVLALSFVSLEALASSTAAGPIVQDAEEQASSERDDFTQRLERLAERLEAERIEQHVPGMSLAVVRGDELVFARGFGFADLEKQREVTPQTIFSIGSTTKGFTATLIGILADEGRLDWDDPVTQHIPWFKLAIDRGAQDAEEVQVTLRDLLCHRTGFVRMNALLLNRTLSSEEILRAATGAEPWSPFRSKFNYSNVMFLAAGVSAGIAAESDWSTALRKRLLDPLGMSSTSLTPTEVREDPRLAEGYMWLPEEEDFQHRTFPDATRIGPAGSINSNVIDMARWLRFQLAGGVIDGERLIDGDRLAETWRTQTPMSGGVSYGLGWVLRDLNGRRVVEHGGNLEGFTAEVCMFPDSDLGYVLLMNVAGASLRGESMVLVAEYLLGELEESEQGGLGRAEVEDFLGEYVANYLHHTDEVYEVVLVDGALTLDIPTQQPYALVPPDDEGRWYFAASNTVGVAFDQDTEGRVVGLSIYTSGFRFEVPRKGLEPTWEIPLEDLQHYLGNYGIEGEDKTLALTVQDGRLAASLPGLPTLLLQPPDEERVRRSRTHDEVELRFIEDAEGAIVSLSLSSPWITSDFTRLDSGPASTLPTLEQILELRGNTERGQRLSALGGIAWRGKIAFPQSGVSGKHTAWSDGLSRYCQEVDLGQFGSLRASMDGDLGWEESPPDRIEEVKGARLAQLRASSGAAPAGDWFDLFETASVLGRESLDGREVARVRLVPAAGPPLIVVVDLESGDTLEEHGASLIPGGLGSVPYVTRYSDWRDVNGLRMPFLMTTEQGESGRTIITIEEIETGLQFEEGFFGRSR